MLLNISNMFLFIDMPQTSELRLTPAAPPTIIAKGSYDAKICNSPGCVHTGTQFYINYPKTEQQ